jgi:hypothetical protein
MIICVPGDKKYERVSESERMDFKHKTLNVGRKCHKNITLIKRSGKHSDQDLVAAHIWMPEMEAALKLLKCEEISFSSIYFLMKIIKILKSHQQTASTAFVYFCIKKQHHSIQMKPVMCKHP